MAGLFGGSAQSRQPTWQERLAMMGATLRGGPAVPEQMRQWQMQQDQTAAEDRLRAQLSPADTAQGSGTGAMPSIEQQMAALQDAQLVNPQAAEKLAPVVQARAAQGQLQQRIQQAASLFPDDQRAQAMWAAQVPEFLKANAEQYSPQVVGAGASQVVNGRRTVEQPLQMQSGDSIVSLTSGGANPIYTRTTPSISEGIAQQNANNGSITANRPQLTTVSPGQQFFGTTPSGQTTQLGESTAPRPIPDAIRRDNERDQAEIDARQAVIDRVGNAIGLIQNNVVNLDPMSRASAWVRNNTGMSSPQSQGLAELRRTVETLRNGILNDATGPQTDGDSLRALNQILQGWGDENVVLQGLQAYQDIQMRKTESQRNIMQSRMGQYADGAPPLAGGQGQSSAGPIAVNRQTGERIQWNGQAWVPVR